MKSKHLEVCWGRRGLRRCRRRLRLHRRLLCHRRLHLLGEACELLPHLARRFRADVLRLAVPDGGVQRICKQKQDRMSLR